jgi:hypothetical protein
MTAPALPRPAQIERINEYREARRKGVAWLLQQLNPDGSIGDPSTGFSYYRAPWTFTVTGETEAATAISGWIRRNLVAADGTIDGPYRVFDEWATYRDATLVVGAQLASQYDLSLRLWQRIRELRDDASGIFPHDRLPGGGTSDVLDATAGGAGVGFAALAVGDLESARRIAGFLQRLWSTQADPNVRFYHNWSRTRQRPVTEADPEFRVDMVLDTQLDAPQFWFLGGICAAFLGRLWLVDPKPEYLALARQYQGQAIAATDGQFNYPAACKGSWGSSILYQITGEPQYRAFTERMGDWYVARQEPQGWWHPLEVTTPGDVIEVTLEFVMHLDTLIGGLASRAAIDG